MANTSAAHTQHQFYNGASKRHPSLTRRQQQSNEPQKCPLHETTPALCKFCKRQYLQAARSRWESARHQNEQVREEYMRVVKQEQTEWSGRIWHESTQIRERLAALDSQSSQWAVMVTSRTAQNQERHRLLQENLSLVYERRQVLRRLASPSESVLESARQRIQQLRYHWVLHVFESLRVTIDNDMEDESDKQDSSSRKQLRGVGKIGGLPLPHAGVELYSVLPPQECTSAIRLVALVTYSVAVCLGITLPHPILLRREARVADIANLHTDEEDEIDFESSDNGPTKLKQSARRITSVLSGRAGHPSRGSATEGSSWNSTAMSWTNMGQAVAKYALTKVLPKKDDPPTSDRLTPVRSPDQNALLCATTAVLLDSPHGERYKLQAPFNKSSSDGLQLLGNDVLYLCMQAGVSVHALWPPEAVLLNLQALQLFCFQQVNENLKEDEG